MRIFCSFSPLKILTVYPLAGLGLYDRALSSAACAAALFAEQLGIGELRILTKDDLCFARSRVGEEEFNAGLRGLTMAVYHQVTALAALRRDFFPALELGLLLSEQLVHDDGFAADIRGRYARAVQAAVGPGPKSKNTDEGDYSCGRAPHSSSSSLSPDDPAGQQRRRRRRRPASASLSREDGLTANRDSDGGGNIGVNQPRSVLPKLAVSGPREQRRSPDSDMANEIGSAGKETGSAGKLPGTCDCGMQTHIVRYPTPRAGPRLPAAAASGGSGAVAGPRADSPSPRTSIYTAHFGISWRVAFGPRPLITGPGDSGRGVVAAAAQDRLGMPFALGQRAVSAGERLARMPALPGAAGADGCWPLADAASSDRHGAARLADAHGDVTRIRIRLAEEAAALGGLGDREVKGPAGARDSDLGRGQDGGTGPWTDSGATGLATEGGMGWVAGRYLQALAAAASARIQRTVRGRAARRAAAVRREARAAEAAAAAARAVQAAGRGWLARRECERRRGEPEKRAR